MQLAYVKIDKEFSDLNINELGFIYDTEKHRSTVYLNGVCSILDTVKIDYVLTIPNFEYLYYTAALFRHLMLISDESIKKFLIEVFNTLPVKFWQIPASTSGKYHPKESNTIGGLVKHTLATVYFTRELCSAFGCKASYADILLGASMLHDIGKALDEPHDIVAATGLRHIAKNYTSGEVNELVECVRWHMGRWATGSTDCQPNEVGNKKFPFDFTIPQQILHMADYAASRKRVNFDYEDLLCGNI